MFKKNKYNARKAIIDGYKFDSIMEAKHYNELKLRQRASEIKILELQPKVYLTRAKILMKPDFLIEENGKKIYIDVKGMATAVFNLKARLWKHYMSEELHIIYKNKVKVIKGMCEL